MGLHSHEGIPIAGWFAMEHPVKMNDWYFFCLYFNFRKPLPCVSCKTAQVQPGKNWDFPSQKPSSYWVPPWGNGTPPPRCTPQTSGDRTFCSTSFLWASSACTCQADVNVYNVYNVYLGEDVSCCDVHRGEASETSWGSIGPLVVG